MGKVRTGLGVSLDGFISGPNDGPAAPMGVGVERLLAWYGAGDTDYRLPGTDMVWGQGRRRGRRQHRAAVPPSGTPGRAPPRPGAGPARGGVSLFDHLGSGPIDLECTRVIEGAGVTHLTFRVLK